MKTGLRKFSFNLVLKAICFVGGFLVDYKRFGCIKNALSLLQMKLVTGPAFRIGVSAVYRCSASRDNSGFYTPSFVRGRYC